MTTSTFHLTCNDEIDAIAQARFHVEGDKVHVLAITGAVSYYDQSMTCEEARAVWKELIGRGWVPPMKQKPASDQTLRARIRD